MAEYTAEWSRLQAKGEAGRGDLKRELDTIQRKLSGPIDAISEGMRAPGLQQKLDELETRKRVLVSGLASHPGSAPRLHPGLAERYREKVEHLGAALAGPDGTA